MKLYLNPFLLVYILILICSGVCHAQIGYQVALINNASGEPRALETVQVELSITDSQENQIYSATKKATTNDFGILSLTIGDANTFDNVDWSKLPLFVSAKIDGQLVSKSQILNVPVAEYAKRSGVLTPEILCLKPFTYKYENHADKRSTNYTAQFYSDKSGTIIIEGYEEGYYRTYGFHWYLDGNQVVIVYDNGGADMAKYIPELDAIYLIDYEEIFTRN